MAAERVEGVREAEFAYPEGTGLVIYDTTVTSDSVIMADVERATGFGLAVREPGGLGLAPGGTRAGVAGIITPLYP